MSMLIVSVASPGVTTFRIVVGHTIGPTVAPGEVVGVQGEIGDLIRAFNESTFNPDNLLNGSLVYFDLLPSGIGWIWLLNDSTSELNLIETTSAQQAVCDNAVSCCTPVFGVSPPNPPPPPIVYYNTEQCATATCPNGEPGASVTVCKDAGLFSDTSQIGADNQAYAAALAEANNQLNCGLAGQLNGLSWLMPSKSGATNPCTCDDPADQTEVAVGNVGQTYTVQLRIRGLIELKPYTLDGVGGAANSFVFLCSNPSQAIPAAAGEPTNEYALVITDPAATIFLNNSPPNTIPTQSTAVDYQVTVQIKTGATVKLVARAIDGLEFNNAALTVVNNAPPTVPVTEPYLGQFLEMIVLSIY